MYCDNENLFFNYNNDDNINIIIMEEKLIIRYDKKREKYIIITKDSFKIYDKKTLISKL